MSNYEIHVLEQIEMLTEYKMEEAEEDFGKEIIENLFLNKLIAIHCRSASIDGAFYAVTPKGKQYIQS